MNMQCNQVFIELFYLNWKRGKLLLFLLAIKILLFVLCNIKYTYGNDKRISISKKCAGISDSCEIGLHLILGLQ